MAGWGCRVGQELCFVAIEFEEDLQKKSNMVLWFGSFYVGIGRYKYPYYLRMLLRPFYMLFSYIFF